MNYMSTTKDIVSVKDLTISYQKGKKTIENCSFSVQLGEVLGLLGSNGAGKSTILKTLAGFNQDFKGTITLFGFNLTDTESIKSKIAFVPQYYSLFLEFTVSENLSYMLDAYNIHGDNKIKRMNYLLETFLLKPFENMRARRLSGGYRRLLNIALSFVVEPELIFFDEPTAGLDQKTRKLFINFILSLKKLKKTIILTTHYLDEAQILCDKMVLLNMGKVVASGKIDELIKTYGGHYQIYLVFNEFHKDSISFFKDLSSCSFVSAENNVVNLTSKQSDISNALFEITGVLKSKKLNIKDIDIREPSLAEVFGEVIR